MSIEIKEARRKLDLLEEVPCNPKLIFTDLFTKDSDDHNFLFQVDIQGKQFSEHIPEYLQEIEVFTDTIISVWGTELHIYVPSLKFGEHQNLQPDDRILEINLRKKTYDCQEIPIKDYTSALEQEYELEICELSDFWKKFEDFSFKKRLKSAFSYLKSDKKLYRRLFNFVFVLTVSRKKVDTALNREKENIIRKNKRNLHFYKERTELQNFYKENVPAQIEKIRGKQEEIKKYLRGLGYTENYVMDENA